MSERTIIVRNCKYCNRKFTPSKDQLKKGWGIYCSSQCGYKDRKPRDFEERFWERVDKKGPDECWIFNGARKNGYAFIKTSGKSELAHRESYRINKGPIPEGLVVMHECDNRPCVNPRHLKLGTQLQNIEDMVRKGRARSNGIGSKSPRSVLSEKQRIEIKRIYSGGVVQKVQLARQFGVCKQTIGNILGFDYN